ncbi:MAG: zinc-binding protein [Zoogloea sp.]|nr:zinc-binding protein [Zoogloea sp.]
MSSTAGPNERLPLMYACSGCSSSAQMSNYLALRIDRLGVAEMSCIAGVGGGVAPLLRLARSGRPILAVDGCQLGCVRACLEGQGITPDIHVVLTEHGVHKRQHADFDFEQAEEMANTVITAAVSLGGALA